MGVFGDESGLLWVQPPKVIARGRAAPTVRKSDLSSLPPPVWMPPNSFPSLSSVPRIAVDVESNDRGLREGLGPGYPRGDDWAHIVGMSIGTDDGRRWYFPVRHEGGDNLDPVSVMRWARSELNAYTGEVVGARLIYDLEALDRWDVTFPLVKRFHDIQIAEPLLDEHRLEYNLDALSFDYLGVGKEEELLTKIAAMYGHHGNKQVKENIYKFRGAYVGPYAEGDADRPLRILPMQMQRLADEGLLELYDLECRLIRPLLAMRKRGVRVDVGRAEEVRDELIKVRDDFLKKFRHFVGDQAELMAPDSFAAALVERGLPVPKTKSTKKYSITKPWLKRFETDAAVSALLNGRAVNTIINTFINGHILGHHVNGRIHAEFHQLKSDEGGTIGRFSSSNPNLQNISARDKVWAPIVRSLFLPDEGDEWERHDQSQMEYRLQAHYAVGPGAAECRESYIKDPKTDYHKLAATMMNIDPEDEVERKRVKNINFAKGYGAQAPRLADLMNCSIREAEEFIKRYESALPFTVETFKKAQRTAAEKGYITSILGRRGRFHLFEPSNNSRMKRDQRKPPLRHDAALKLYGPGITRANTYTALNNLLQFGNADYTKKVMVDVWESGCSKVLGAFLLQVHDELDYSVPKTRLGDEAAKEARHIMEHAIKLRVPVLVDAKRGENWAKTS